MIQTKNLVKTFKNGDVETHVLRGIDFEARDGEFIAIMGRSGAGKSTFLYQMSLLDEPTSGDVIVDGHSTREMTDAQEVSFRLHKFGYVFQDYALLPDLTALENVVLPLLMQRINWRVAYTKAADALSKVKMEQRLHNLPSQLSGGEQQRVSIARAIAHRPKILFADEPTANLDNESSGVIMEIFKQLHNEGQTIIMVTHEEPYAALAETIVKLDDGEIVSTHKN
ncbi:MAG: putative ABC transport system ATP-binding protein [Parcubacteria group bacterium Gr01-1014_70]|nr:MAG: putative ABC transport system ATP-binding protein [Parcubacteria group bacterium Gr01-1014_70]